MVKARTLTKALGAAALLALAGPALADGGYEGSVKDAPAAEEGRKLALSFTAAGVSEYVFRGISQTAEDPTVQASVDATYGILYAGVWASGLDFGNEVFAEPFVLGEDAEIEIDVYGGIKPVWGDYTFDFGVIGYLYPGASDRGGPGLLGGEQDYVEFKAGVSRTYFEKLAVSSAVYFSPEYNSELGETIVTETTAAYTLPALWIFTPSISGTFGAVYGEEDDDFEAFFGDDKYYYWNAGVALAVEKFTFDFRYWDTDLGNTYQGSSENLGLGGDVFSYDERFVFTAKITLP